MRMDAFHQRGWEDRAKLIPTIEDERYRELAQRILATESPDLVTAEQRARWDAWRRQRFFPESDVPWLTVPRALEEVADLSRNLQPVQRRQLHEIEEFLKNLTE